MKYLLIIDDQPLREAAFAKAEKIIKKIDQLEQDLNSFHEQDQQLFSSWFELTFRAERKRITQRHEDFRGLARFHNWMIALAQQLDISLPMAFAILREEEADYARGTNDLRAQIDETRRQRDADIREQLNDDDELSDEFSDESGDDFDDDQSDEPRTRDPQEEIELNAVRQMSDKKIRAICLGRDGAYALLGMILAFARTRDEQTLFLRVWELVPQKYQTSFAKDFAKQMGFPLSRLIDDYRDKSSQGSLFDDEPDGEFSDDFIGARSSGTSGRARAGAPPKDFETTKVLYRKLVRLLHPDLQTHQDGPGHWQKQIWHRVQTAYSQDNHRALEKLYRLVLIRERNLNELSVSEIVESQNWLKEEFDQLALEAKDLKRRPAWGFSKKKDYASLKRKLEKPLQAELDAIDAQIKDLEAQHVYLDRLSKSNLREDRQRRKRRRTSGRSGARRSYR